MISQLVPYVLLILHHLFKKISQEMSTVCVALPSNPSVPLNILLQGPSFSSRHSGGLPTNYNSLCGFLVFFLHTEQATRCFINGNAFIIVLHNYTLLFSNGVYFPNVFCCFTMFKERVFFFLTAVFCICSHMGLMFDVKGKNTVTLFLFLTIFHRNITASP